MSLFTQSSVSPKEYILKQSLIYLGQRKIADDKLDKIKTNEDNIKSIDDFLANDGRLLYMFAVINSSGAPVSYLPEPPATISRKCVLCLRARSPKSASEPFEITPQNIEDEVIFMELNKQILENLHMICNEVFMPVLGNPLNMVGWSDLVSKDLMDKFHGFLAHTYVTIGCVKGRTLLPLPPSDVTSSEKTSSKDKA